MPNSTPLERKIEILKLLQGKKMRIGEIADHFGVDERTIRADVQELRDGANILGVTVKIESRHEGSQRHYYTSNVHPVLLALNSSELYALLRLLEDAMRRKATGEVYKHIFEHIYGQITDYALALYSNKLREASPRTPAANRLEEEAFRKELGYRLTYWLKSGRYIKVTYTDAAGISVETEAMLIDVRERDSKLVLRDKKGAVLCLNYNDVCVHWESVPYK